MEMTLSIEVRVEDEPMMMTLFILIFEKSRGRALFPFTPSFAKNSVVKVLLTSTEIYEGGLDLIDPFHLIQFLIKVDNVDTKFSKNEIHNFSIY